MATATAAQPSPIAGFARWVPSLPTITLNSLNPFASTESGNAAKTQQTTSDSTNKRPALSTVPVFDPSNPAANGPPSPSRSNGSIMFAEPDTRSTSEEGSREGSIDDGSKLRLKRSNKAKTKYSICHPAPSSSTRQKLHRRPRSLMQLHKLSTNARPRPAFEVIPSANFSVRLTRAITKVFKAKHGLCPNDLVVLRAENYLAVGEEDEEEEAHVIGLICKGRRDDSATAAGKAKICVAGDGNEWEAYPLINGGYEFFSTDEHGLGLTVRWVPKRIKDASKAPKDGSKRFNFSTISPNSRRHPVIASLGKTGLEVNDTYKMPDPAAVTPLSTPKKHNSTILEDAMDEEADGKEQCETDDRLREIITLTAIWVAFKEGWSPFFKYEDKEGVRSASSAQNSPSKTGGSPLSTPPGSPRQIALDKRASIKSMSSSIMRRSSLLSKGNRASQISVPEEDEGVLPARSESMKRSGRTRGDSTSTVLVHRAASNRRNKNQATWRPDLLAAQNQLQENSREDLNGTPPRASAKSGAIDPWASPDATPVRPQAGGDVAHPLIPSLSGTETPSVSETPSKAGARTPRQVEESVPEVQKPSSPEKRESSTTTETSMSGTGAPAKSVGPSTASNPVKKKGKGRGWRRLLCGSNDI